MAVTTAIRNSEFNMWRTVFAFALADNVLSLEEQALLQSYFRLVPFSTLQLSILRQDLKTPQNIEILFRRLTKRTERTRFYSLARALIWCEAAEDRQKQKEKTLYYLCRLAGDADHKKTRHKNSSPYPEEPCRPYARARMTGQLKNPPLFRVQV